jgi:hypothetical protein
MIIGPRYVSAVSTFSSQKKAFPALTRHSSAVKRLERTPD